MKHTFNVPYLYNPGILTGKLPNYLLKKLKKAVNDPSAKQAGKYNSRLVASIKQEYETPEIPELIDYLDSMYQAWADTFKFPTPEYEIKDIWTNYMKKGEFNPNHNHPSTLAAFVIWVTIPYNLNEELEIDGWENPTHPPKNSAFEVTYSMFDGRTASQPIFVDKSMEGTVTMFPGTLLHCVYPFFTSDGERISVAGNVSPK